MYEQFGLCSFLYYSGFGFHGFQYIWLLSTWWRLVRESIKCITWYIYAYITPKYAVSYNAKLKLSGWFLPLLNESWHNLYLIKPVNALTMWVAWLMSYKRLLTLPEHVGIPLVVCLFVCLFLLFFYCFFYEFVFLIFSVLFWFNCCLSCLCTMSCVPSVVSVTGLSILDFTSRFCQRLLWYVVGLLHTHIN